MRTGTSLTFLRSKMCMLSYSNSWRYAISTEARKKGVLGSEWWKWDRTCVTLKNWNARCGWFVFMMCCFVFNTFRKNWCLWRVRFLIHATLFPPRPKRGLFMESEWCENIAHAWCFYVIEIEKWKLSRDVRFRITENTLALKMYVRVLRLKHQ